MDGCAETGKAIVELLLMLNLYSVLRRCHLLKIASLQACRSPISGEWHRHMTKYKSGLTMNSVIREQKYLSDVVGRLRERHRELDRQTNRDGRHCRPGQRERASADDCLVQMSHATS